MGEDNIHVEKEYLQFYHDGRNGIQDEYGKVIVPALYDFAGLPSDGLINVRNNGYTAYFDENGRMILPFDNRYEWYGDFVEGLAVVRLNNLCGYISKDGTEIIKRQFYFAEDFSNDMAVVRNEKGLHGAIDKNGELVIDYRFNHLFPFINGYAKFGNFKKWGLIDKEGNVVVPQIYHRIVDVNDNKVTVQIKDGENYKEGVLTLGGEVEWNNNLDKLNEFNLKQKEFAKACEILIEKMYASGCPCEYERFRNYINWNRPVQFIDQEILFQAFTKKLLHLNENEFACKICETHYRQKWEQYTAFLWVLDVTVTKSADIKNKGGKILPTIPLALGFRGYELEGLNELYYETSVEEVIDYLKEK